MSAEREVLREWEREYDCEIWEGCDAVIRLYSDRAVYEYDYARWRGNSATLARRKTQVLGEAHARLMELHLKQTADEAADWSRAQDECPVDWYEDEAFGAVAGV